MRGLTKEGARAGATAGPRGREGASDEVDVEDAPRLGAR